MTEKPRTVLREAVTNASAEALSAFLHRAFPADKNLSSFEALANVVCGRTDELPSGLFLDAHDVHFARVIDRNARRARVVTATPNKLIQIGPELDFLANLCFPDQLSAIQIACLASQCRRVARKRVAIVVTARDEGIYLPEWLAHHRLIGAEHVFIYTNDNRDGSDVLLRNLARDDFVTVIENSSAKGVNPQRKVYQHAMLLLEELRDYRWALFIDADEFLNFMPPRVSVLPDFIDEVERDFAGNLPGAIVFPWNWRFTDRAFQREEIGVLRYYSHGGLHKEVKSLINVQATLGMCEVHVPTLDEDAFFLDGQMRSIRGKAVWSGVERPYRGPVVEHYWAKSFIEFLVKKKRTEDLALPEGLFRRDFDLFFAWTAPWLAENFEPIPNAWIEEVERLAEELISTPLTAASYRAVIERHNVFKAEASNDHGLQKLYHDLLASTKMSM